jgi:hypothetical protein
MRAVAGSVPGSVVAEPIAAGLAGAVGRLPRPVTIG